MYAHMYVLKFPKEITDQPIICKLVREYDVEFNILKADILVQQEGLMVLELRGAKAKVDKGLNFLKQQGVHIKSIAASISRDDEKCFQCGACTGICPTNALFVSRPEMAIMFDPDKCSGCGLCVTLCPVRAMEVSLNNMISSLN